MSHVHESCHMCIRHVTCVWVMSHVSESYLWLHFIFLQCTHTHPRLHKPIYGNTFRYTSVSHVYKSCRMRRRHITRVWVILLVYESYNMSEWVLFRASHCFPSRKISCRSVATRRRKICGILSAVTGVGLDNIQTQSVSSSDIVSSIFDTVSEDTTLTQSLTLCLKIPLSPNLWHCVWRYHSHPIFDTVSEDTTVVHLWHSVKRHCVWRHCVHLWHCVWRYHCRPSSTLCPLVRTHTSRWYKQVYHLDVCVCTRGRCEWVLFRASRRLPLVRTHTSRWYTQVYVSTSLYTSVWRVQGLSHTWVSPSSGCSVGVGVGGVWVWVCGWRLTCAWVTSCVSECYFWFDHVCMTYVTLVWVLFLGSWHLCESYFWVRDICVSPISGFTMFCPSAQHSKYCTHQSRKQYLLVHLNITCAWVMSHVHESCYMCMRHVTCVYVCHMCMRHVTCVYVMSHVYASRHMCMSHITSVWVISHVYTSYQ